MGWEVAKVECPLCTQEWIAVYPSGVEKLECPHCQNTIEPIILEIQE
jgi:transposase-like protein